MPSATARLLREATSHGRPVRALVALLVAAVLGVGGYAAGLALIDPTPERQPEAAGSTASYDGGQPEPGPGVSRSSDRTAGGRSAEPSPSATEQSEEPEEPAATTAATATPQPRLSSAAGEPSTPAGGPSTTPSTPASPTPTPSPSQTGSNTSAAPQDTTPPQTSLSGDFPAPDAAVFTLGANEPATFTCSLDGAAYTSCGSTVRYLGLVAGWHTLAVRATDAAGNTDPTPAERSWHANQGEPTD